MLARHFAAVFVVAALTIASYDAKAQWVSYGGGGFGCCFGSIYSTESVPYFAKHPPVYYSRHIARPYGFSPYPYLAGLISRGDGPLFYMQYPLVDVDRDAASDRQTRPLRIDNPFVAPVEKSPTAKTYPSQRQPKIVYPVRLAQETQDGAGIR